MAQVSEDKLKDTLEGLEYLGVLVALARIVHEECESYGAEDARLVLSMTAANRDALFYIRRRLIVENSPEQLAKIERGLLTVLATTLDDRPAR